MVRTSDIVLVLVAIIFPPAAAAFLTGCSCDLLINIALSILGVIPGHIHAFWLIYKNAQAEERYGKGNFTYVGNATYEPLDVPSNQHAIHGAPPPTYGTTYGTA